MRSSHFSIAILFHSPPDDIFCPRNRPAAAVPMFCVPHTRTPMRRILQLFRISLYPINANKLGMPGRVCSCVRLSIKRSPFFCSAVAWAKNRTTKNAFRYYCPITPQYKPPQERQKPEKSVCMAQWHFNHCTYTHTKSFFAHTHTGTTTKYLLNRSDVTSTTQKAPLLQKPFYEIDELLLVCPASSYFLSARSQYANFTFCFCTIFEGKRVLQYKATENSLPQAQAL